MMTLMMTMTLRSNQKARERKRRQNTQWLRVSRDLEGLALTCEDDGQEGWGLKEGRKEEIKVWRA